MREDQILLDAIGIVFTPSISVNNQTYRGDMSNGNNLFKALCSVMIDRPVACGGVSIDDRYDPEGFYSDPDSEEYKRQEE